MAIIAMSELANTPIDMMVGGVALKVRRIGLNRLYAAVEVDVQSNYLALTRKLAESLEAQARGAFLRSAAADAPTGAKLMEACTQALSTIQGRLQAFRLATVSSGLTAEQIDALYYDDPFAEVGAVIDRALDVPIPDGGGEPPLAVTGHA